MLDLFNRIRQSWKLLYCIICTKLWMFSVILLLRMNSSNLWIYPELMLTNTVFYFSELYFKKKKSLILELLESLWKVFRNDFEISWLSLNTVVKWIIMIQYGLGFCMHDVITAVVCAGILLAWFLSSELLNCSIFNAIKTILSIRLCSYSCQRQLERQYERTYILT